MKKVIVGITIALFTGTANFGLDSTNTEISAPEERFREEVIEESEKPLQRE